MHASCTQFARLVLYASRTHIVRDMLMDHHAAFGLIHINLEVCVCVCVRMCVLQAARC